jgi:hypothetical protein
LQVHPFPLFIITLPDLKPGKEVFLLDIPLNDKNGSYLHTITCGSEDNPNKLLLIPGYGGGIAMFYKIFKELS